MFCTDDELAFGRSRSPFDPAAPLVLDETYRLAHLPLVAPRHPRVIASQSGAMYEMGRHPCVYSLVLPVPADALEASADYRELVLELRSAPFARKVAWTITERRREKLHATVCGSLGIGSLPPIDSGTRRELSRLGPVRAEIRGLFSGNVNVGRLYLRIYPERRHGTNVFHALQRVMGRPTTDLYVVGIWNLTDDLDPHEAGALAALIERWWSRRLLRIDVTELWLLGSNDDLVLDSEVAEQISLT